MEKIESSQTASRLESKSEDPNLTAEEAAQQLVLLMGSKAQRKKVALSIRMNVMRAGRESYSTLEDDLISEAITRILSGKRKWPRNIW